MIFSERPPLSNPRSERIRKIIALGGRSARLKTGLILVEGPSAVRELLLHRPDCVRDVYFVDSPNFAHADVVEMAAETISWVHPVTPEVSHKISTDSQGIVAVAKVESLQSQKTLVEISQSGRILAMSAQPAALGSRPEAPGQSPVVAPIVVLSCIQDPGNLGTLIRVADAFGASGVVVLSGSAEVGSPKVIRASVGSCFHLPILKLDTLTEVVSALHPSGWQILGTSGGHGTISLDDLVLEGLNSSSGVLAAPHAWVFGNEAQGLTDNELAACDRVVKLEMTGQAESLNVAAAASCVLYAAQLVRMLPARKLDFLRDNQNVSNQETTG